MRIYTGTDSTGKHHYHNQTITGNKKDAEEWLMNVSGRIQNGELLKDSVDTFDAYFAEWLRQCAGTATEAHQAVSYQTVAALPAAETAGRHTRKAIQKHYTRLSEQGLSPGTISLAHAVLPDCMKQALRVRRNPLEGVIPPQKDSADEGADGWTDAEAPADADRSSARIAVSVPPDHRLSPW